MQTLSRQAIVPDELAGKRLDQAAALVLPEFSRTRLKQWIQSGQLTLDGATVDAKQRVCGGERLNLEATLEPLSAVGPEAIPLDVVYEDGDVIVIDKPAGLVVHPGAGNWSGTLQNALLAFDQSLEAVPRAGLVHRLDKDTSGLLVVARNLNAQTQLVSQIQARSMARVYQAVCQSTLTGGGVVDAPIDRHYARSKTHGSSRTGSPGTHALHRSRSVPRAYTYRSAIGNRAHPSNPRAYGTHSSPASGRSGIRR